MSLSTFAESKTDTKKYENVQQIYKCFHSKQVLAK